MKKGSLKFNTRRRSTSNTYAVDGNAGRIMLRVILSSLAMLGFLYIFLVTNMIFNIVERRSLEINARALAEEVRDLEYTYLSVSTGVDLALAHSLGFTETKATFITRKTLGYQSAVVAPDFQSSSSSSDSVNTSQNGI
jgi:hypothetical protein